MPPTYNHGTSDMHRPTIQTALLTDDSRRCSRLRHSLLSWYAKHKRDLPWRADRDPYRVWLSEIMLQQTRVAAVREHYLRFLERFPTVGKLAAARESSVLAAWSGLGYYRRARLLHRAAREVASRGGVFPGTAAELRQLPGIGRYTAAAIASICFEEPVAVVDGNVERVIGRLLGKNLAPADVWNAAQSLVSRDAPGDFNQAMTELGATVCLPANPRCPQCPVRNLCLTRGALATREPVRPQQRRQVFCALAAKRRSVLLAQREPDAALMPGMWELPQFDAAPAGTTIAFSVRHSITTTDYTVQVVRDSSPQNLAGAWVPQSRLAAIPLTGLTRKILRKAALL